MHGNRARKRTKYFNPRPPRGGRPSNHAGGVQSHYFNPRPPRGGRRFDALKVAGVFVISIHALREEGDACAVLLLAEHVVISIHALREESDTPTRIPASTHTYFNPRPPRGGRPRILPRSQTVKYFNPRPPRGGRLSLKAKVSKLEKFQSTPSARRATGPGQDKRISGKISIHALREEGDSKSSEKIHHVCSIIHTCAQFEKELYEGSGEMQNKSC